MNKNSDDTPVLRLHMADSEKDTLSAQWPDPRIVALVKFLARCDAEDDFQAAKVHSNSKSKNGGDL